METIEIGAPAKIFPMDAKAPGTSAADAPLGKRTFNSENQHSTTGEIDILCYGVFHSGLHTIATNGTAFILLPQHRRCWTSGKHDIVSNIELTDIAQVNDIR